MVGRNRSNIAMKCWCFLWIIAVFCYKTTEASTTATPDDPCGTLAEISEKLWKADSGSRFTFGDVESVFPDLTNFSDAAISQAIEMTSEESLPDIIVLLGAAKRGQNSGNSTKLFQFVKRKVYNDYHFSDILDTFNPQPLRRDAPLSGDKFYNIQEFLNSISYSNVMGELSTYLNCKGSDYASDIWDILSGLWFSGYSRYYAQCGEDSSGFEYTFVGEYTLEGRKVLGLHNWINLYWLERGNEMQYESFNGLYKPNLLALSFTWNGREQSQGSVFLGTSPEFELAIYTLCFLEKVGQDCTLSLGGHEITLRTFEFDHTVQAAYPVIPTYNYNPDPPPTPSYRINVHCNPTTPPPRTACDSLSEIAEKLWTGDSNRLSFGDIATSSSSADIVLDFNTGTKLFKYVDDSKVNYPLYKALRNLTDNYDPQPYTDDYVIYPDEVSEVESFLDLLITTRPITELRDYLTCKEHLTDQKDIKSLLWDLWFMEIYRYTEAFGLDSSGFEYTFVGEFDPYDNDVVGLHDWYRLYVLERDGDLNYTGYIDLSQPNLLEVSYTWERHVKNHGYVLLGSSIEFQMAVYTLCYMEMPGLECPLTMGGRVVILMTVDRDGTVSEAYPVSTSPTTTTATSNSTTTTTTTKTTSTTTTTTPTPTTTTTTTTTTPTTTTTTTTPTTTSTTTTTTPTPTTTTTTTTPTPTTTTITTTPAPITTTITATTTPTTTTTTTTPTPTTTTTTTTPTPTTTYPTTTTIPTATTTTPTPTPIRRTPTTVKTPTTTPNSSSSTGGVLVLLMLQLVLHWFLK